MKREYRICVEDKWERTIVPMLGESTFDNENEAIHRLEIISKDFPDDIYFIVPQFTKD